MLLPRMYRIRQTFERPVVREIRGTVESELKKLSLEKRIKPGQRVAITAGSRGVANMAEILRATVDFMKSLGADPFIFPAMGSHGGATAEGQSAFRQAPRGSAARLDASRGRAAARL